MGRKPGRARFKGNSEFNANEKNDVRLNDVLGCDEAKHELSQILEFIKHPEVRTFRLRLPRSELVSHELTSLTTG